MKVIQLFSKQQHGVPVCYCSSLHLKRGVGIQGDVNAIAGNPRQVLCVGTPTLVEFGLNPGDLQENILLDAPVEQFISGQTLQLGQQALIRLSLVCEPCKRLDSLQPNLAKSIGNKRGFLGIVIRDGQIKPGDEVYVTPHQFRPLPEQMKERFSEFVSRIPAGKVVRISDVVLALGATSSYFRVIPTFMKKANPNLPIHRIVATDGKLLTQHIPHQPQTLMQEGIEIVENRILLQQFFWEAIAFHELGEF